MKQHEAVIEAMRANGGYATLGHLYHAALRISGCAWGTKTPFATIRRIVFDRPEFFKIRPGLWGLTQQREQVERQLGTSPQIPPAVQSASSHYYYQGLIVEIGNLRGFATFVPYQDKNKAYLNKTLAQTCTIEKFPEFGYEHILSRARMIDVSWFNTRKMPSEFYEVEHTTGIEGALLRFMELQDFAVQFNIVADSARKQEYQTKVSSNTFSPIKARTRFIDYEALSDYHAKVMAAEQSAKFLFTAHTV